MDDYTIVDIVPIPEAEIENVMTMSVDLDAGVILFVEVPAEVIWEEIWSGTLQLSSYFCELELYSYLYSFIVQGGYACDVRGPNLELSKKV